MNSTRTLRHHPLVQSSLIHVGFVGAAFLIVLGEKLLERGPISIPIEVLDQPQVTAITPMAPPKPIEKKVQPRAVFGASRKTITSSTDEGLTTKAGNTVAKAPDNEKLRDDDADQLPIPAEEYLVSVMPKLIGDIRVPYPAPAKKAGVEGAVVFDLLIDAKGAVRDARFVSGPGYGLNEAAGEAVRRLRFEPARIQDQPVAVRIRYAYRFVIER